MFGLQMCLGFAMSTQTQCLSYLSPIFICFIQLSTACLCRQNFVLHHDVKGGIVIVLTSMFLECLRRLLTIWIPAVSIGPTKCCYVFRECQPLPTMICCSGVLAISLLRHVTLDSSFAWCITIIPLHILVTCWSNCKSRPYLIRPKLAIFPQG